MRKTEPGNAINYVTYLMAILLTTVLFCYAIFNDESKLAEEVCENGLHIIESGVLALNRGGETLGPGEIAKLPKSHIISGVTYTKTKSATENTQVNAVGNYITTNFRSHMGLNSSSAVPQKGILKNICKGDSVTLQPVKIYEPVYTITATIGNLTLTGKMWSEIIQKWKETDGVKQWDDPAEISKNKSGSVSYAITGWVIYTLNFDANNNYIGYDKNTSTTAPSLKRDPSLKTKSGAAVEGATIEISMDITLHGVKQIFAESTATQIFATNPAEPTYKKTITQAADIVIAEKDSRVKK